MEIRKNHSFFSLALAREDFFFRFVFSLRLVSPLLSFFSLFLFFCKRRRRRGTRSSRDDAAPRQVPAGARYVAFFSLSLSDAFVRDEIDKMLTTTTTTTTAFLYLSLFPPSPSRDMHSQKRSRPFWSTTSTRRLTSSSTWCSW